jgi:fibronectin-binding autotransporter adhesin
MIVTNWIAIGRNTGGLGVYNLTGGTLMKVSSGNRMNVGENSSGTLNVSGTGTVLMGAAEMRLGVGSAGNGTVNLNGGSITVNRVNRGTGTGTFNFNGGTLIAGDNATNAVFFGNLTAANVLTNGAIIDSGTNIITVTQALLDGTGGGGLTKLGNGTLILNGANTYTGSTLINAGTIGGSGTIAGPVSVASGARLSPGTSIGTLTVNNTLNLAAGSTTFVEVSFDGGVTNNDVVTGLTGVTYGGSLVVSNSGAAPLVAGTVYKLFNSAAPGTGNFSSVTVLPSGSATFNPSTGELTINSSGVLALNPPKFSGGNLILTGTGTPGSGYSILTSTNVATPLSLWTTNVSGTFDGSGALSNAIPVSISEPTRFFLLRQP